MRAEDGSRPCREAAPYYYDLLSQEGATVPESVRRHVATCPACREQMRRLREILFQGRYDEGPTGAEDETVAALIRQFGLLDECVSCSEARPFLPELAAESPPIRIPTPVTVHVECCRQCSRDLAALREMDLTCDQLKRLAQLFASGSGVDLPVRPADPGPGDIPPLRPGPAATAPQHDTRATAPTRSPPTDRAGMACEEISTADLFDWLVPGGPVPAGKGTPDGRGTAVAAHLRGCPACRERARMLHDILCGMIERSDSGTTTIYQTQSEVEDAHQYPVSVQVLHDSRGAEAASGDLPAARTARTSPGGGPAERLETVGRGTWYGGPWAKVAGIVIIVAVLAMLVRPTAPVASGTFSGDVLKVLAQVPSAHIVATSPDCGFIYECWIAYRSGRMVRRMGRECTLYDLERGDMRTLDIQAGTWDCVKLDHIRHARIREAMVGYLGGILERISAGGGSPLPADDPASQAVENADVYELKADTGRRASRLLAYIDRVTGLPRKTELYSHVPGETRWRLATTTVFTYPSEQEVESCIQAFSRAP